MAVSGSVHDEGDAPHTAGIPPLIRVVPPSFGSRVMLSTRAQVKTCRPSAAERVYSAMAMTAYPRNRMRPVIKVSSETVGLGTWKLTSHAFRRPILVRPITASLETTLTKSLNG